MRTSMPMQARMQRTTANCTGGTVLMRLGKTQKAKLRKLAAGIDWNSGVRVMRRLISFRDFDWLLLTFVLIICSLGVLEIYSTTYGTKFAGAHVARSTGYWAA